MCALFFGGGGWKGGLFSYLFRGVTRWMLRVSFVGNVGHGVDHVVGKTVIPRNSPSYSQMSRVYFITSRTHSSQVLGSLRRCGYVMTDQTARGFQPLIQKPTVPGQLMRLFMKWRWVNYSSLVLLGYPVRRCLGTTKKTLQNHLQKGLEHKGMITYERIPHPVGWFTFFFGWHLTSYPLFYGLSSHLYRPLSSMISYSFIIPQGTPHTHRLSHIFI